MAKANKDGWIRHRSGKCPVEAGTLVDVRTRYDGEFFEVEAINGWAEDWSHTGDGGDIMAYRIHKPDVIRSEVVESLKEERKDTEETEMPAAKYFDGPIQWRDRIESLKDERQRMDAEYQSRVSENESEIADLTAKLAAEGFALIGRINVKMDESLPNQEADMSDWRNWKVGDRVVMLETIGDNAEKDQVMIIAWIDVSCDLFFDDQPIRVVPEFDMKDGWWPRVDELKWHSRPSK